MLACLLLGIVGVGSSPAPTLNLIPSPQLIQMTRGRFEFDKEIGIYLGNRTDKDDAFAADQLRQEVQIDVGVKVKEFEKNRGKRFALGVIGRDKDIDAELKRAKLQLPSGALPGAYIVSVQRDKVIIGGADSAGVFYGVQTVKQLLRANFKDGSLPCVDITDWPALRYRAWQDDISRGPIPTLDFLKREIRTLAEFKLNAFTMYTEHVFKLQKHPTIAPPDGLTAQEVEELCDYAAKYHVEVIGNFQSFGHFANILSVPGYGDLGEAGWVLSPAKEESYKFLADVYSEIAPAYASPLFNINCDETAGLGEGASKELVKELGIGGVYARHINRIADLLKPYGKTPMMWGDIALQHPEIVPQLPKDLVVLSWGYDPRDSFDSAIEPFTKLGFRFMVCPGVSCWGQVFPDYDAAEVNISNYVRDGNKFGALGMLNTSWDDTGENFLSTSFLPFAWGADVSWKPVSTDATSDDNTAREQRLAQFNAAFQPIFFGPGSSSEVQDLWASSRLRLNAAAGGMTDGYTWTSLQMVAAEGVSRESAEKLIDDCNVLAGKFRDEIAAPGPNKDTLSFALYAVDRLRLTGQKALTTRLLWESVADASKKEEAVQALTNLTAGYRKLRADYQRLWPLENRPWWLDRNLAKYDAMTKSLDGIGAVPLIAPLDTMMVGPTTITLGTLRPSKIYFTVDGTEPTDRSELYTKPFELSKGAVVKAIAYADGRPGPVATSTYRSLKAAASFETSMQIYNGHKAEYAFDSDPESYFWSNGEARAGDTFVVTLQQPITASMVRVVSAVPDHPDDGVHVGVVELSSDGTTWKTVASFNANVAEASFHPMQVKAVRIRVDQNNGNWLAISDIQLS